MIKIECFDQQKRAFEELANAIVRTVPECRQVKLVDGRYANENKLENDPELMDFADVPYMSIWIFVRRNVGPKWFVANEFLVTHALVFDVGIGSIAMMIADELDALIDARRFHFDDN